MRAAAPGAGARPHIVFLFCDNVGWANVGHPPPNSDCQEPFLGPEIFTNVNPYGEYFLGPDDYPGGPESRTQVGYHRAAPTREVVTPHIDALAKTGLHSD